MPALKSLLKPVEFKIADKKFGCAHNKKHLITKGQNYLQITEKEFYKGRRALVKSGYCMSCAKKIITAGKENLVNLEEDLPNDS